MSFLTRTALRTTATSSLPRTLRSQALFSTSLAARKSATEQVKETAHKVDKTISSKIVDGIEVGENVAQKAKETAGIKTSQAKGAASETAGETKGTASELSGAAKGKASELAGKAEGKKEEIKGRL
ncbi:MAG: hypothetical protein M1818_003098 [Claussenomyces sp. TS43310]|nr:MAG: hypothetical protein M1818_003098 [Claussenomyces sp. TS43310]